MFKLLICLFITFTAHGADRGYEIAKAVEKANEGFLAESADMEMLLINGDKKIKRSMSSKVIEVNESENRTLLEFLLPKDVKGTKLLTWSYDGKDDSQWIYMPAFNKIKRISSSSVTSSFMGSEFTYEDLRAASPEKYTFKFVKEENVKGDTFWIYERKSKKKSGYSKQVVTTSKKYMSVISVNYFDRSGQVLKRAKITDFSQFSYQGKVFWRPGKIEMVNEQTKKISILNWKNRKLGAKFKKKDFVKKSLKQ